MNRLVPTTLRNSVEELRDRVSAVFDRWLHRRSEQIPVRVDEHRWPGFSLGSVIPTISVEETDDDIVVTAEVPGLDKQDFKVELDNTRLILRGEKKSSREENHRNYYYSETSYGSFYQAVPLPCEVDIDKARAKCKHGVLRVTMPKTEQAKSRRFRVKVN